MSAKGEDSDVNPSAPQPQPRTFRWRYILYALAVVITFFLILDGAIIYFEKQGAIDTQSANDAAWLSTGNPWKIQGERFVVGAADQKSMVPMSFKVNKGKAWRAFMLGGSFMRGIPYEGAGTIRFWLKRLLERHFPASEIELINAAAVSQNSHRVRDIVKHSMSHSPDVLIIASCNNEGALAPDEVTKRLHTSGTFRLLKKWLRDDTDDTNRPLHTPQDPDIDTVRNQFRQNLIDMVKMGRRGGAKVFLCTLPVNLRYEGNSPGRPIGEVEHDSTIRWPDCVMRGHSRYTKEEYKEVIATLKQCQHEESLRWSGLSWYALGGVDRARNLLNQYLELVPRNRCRPSFNRVIREVAQRLNVALVDLESAAIQSAVHGLPGSEQFESYCHMNWQSQARMADVIYTALETHKSLPAGSSITPKAEDRGVVFREMKKLQAWETY